MAVAAGAWQPISRPETCTSSTERELASRLDAQSRSIVALEPTALRAWLEEARKEASALFLAFDLMQSHGAAQAREQGENAAQNVQPHNQHKLARVAHLETLCALLERVL